MSSVLPHEENCPEFGMQRPREGPWRASNFLTARPTTIHPHEAAYPRIPVLTPPLPIYASPLLRRQPRGSSPYSRCYAAEQPSCHHPSGPPAIKIASVKQLPALSRR